MVSVYPLITKTFLLRYKEDSNPSCG
jgi:hypothetical protein